MPEEVLLQLQAEFLEWSAQGASILEAPHRSCAAAYLLEETTDLFRKLLKIPSHFHILFMHGGARAQFAAIPMNLLGKSTEAIYVNTGYWSEAAAAEAKRYGSIEEINFLGGNVGWAELAKPNKMLLGFASSAQPTCAYAHYCDNETISGVEFPEPPDVGNLPLISDMSSNILSRPIDWSRFGLVYAGMQKNIGPAGLAVVVVRDDLLDQALSITPSILHYQTQVKHGSAYNTLPLFNIRAAQLVFQWLEKKGGVEEMACINQRKAERVYAVIDKHDMYHNRVDPSCRSRMNITFSLPTQELEEQFIKEANAHQLINLTGHRSGGGSRGIRISLYNAMSEAAVEVLVEFMEGFVKNTIK